MRQERDPIESLKALLLEENHADEDALKALDKQIKARVLESADFAQTSPEPDPSELYTDVVVAA